MIKNFFKAIGLGVKNLFLLIVKAFSYCGISLILSGWYCFNFDIIEKHIRIYTIIMLACIIINFYIGVFLNYCIKVAKYASTYNVTIEKAIYDIKSEKLYH